MAETSFPIEEKPLLSSQWGQVTLGLGSGIMSVSQYQYSYANASNANNTIQILNGEGFAQAIVAGFYHRIDSPVTLSVPAVTSTTTYFIGLTYDPTKHSAAAGPVSLTVTTSVPSGGGKVYLPMFEIRRSSNQLLTDATITNRRIYISPHLTVQNFAGLPTSGVLVTTHATALDSGIDYRLDQSGNWVPVNALRVIAPASMPGWGITLHAGGFTVQAMENGKSVVRASWQLMRQASNFTQGTNWIAHGSPVPAAARAGQSGFRFYAGMLAGRPCDVRIDLATGEVAAKLGSGSVTVTTGDVLAFQSEWTV